MRNLFIYFFLFFFLFSTPLFAPDAEAKKDQADLITAKRFKQAAALYNNISFNRGEERQERWRHCISNFQQVYYVNPSHKTAPLSLFMLGKAYGQIYDRFNSPDDLRQSIGYYEDLSLFFPKHRLADDALLVLGRIAMEKKKDPQKAKKLFARIIAVYPDGDMADSAAMLLHRINGSAPTLISDQTKSHKENLPVKVTANQNTSLPQAHLSKPLRFWSTKNYTRVVIEISQPVRFKEAFLPADGNLPRRLYIDLFNSRIAPTFQNPIPIQDGLLKRVRGAQFDKQTVRVVLDTDSVDSHKIFTLQNPFRVVIDVTGKQKKAHPARLPTLAEQFGLGVKTIVIDPGHGGRDPGAIGVTGLLEKDVVLKVAKKVAAILERETTYKVILTRDSDIYIPLEERTAIANTREADLFVSIHANSAPNKKAKGVETYFLSLATTREEMRAAARENAASQSQLNDLQTILQDLMQNSKIEESAKLAGSVQSQLVNGLKGQYSVKNLGVKKAPFIVLIGARMPAVLTEIAFLSNKEEERRLRDDRYLEAIARHIVGGVKHYAANLNASL